MNQHLILRVVAKILIPLIALFAFYVQFHGDYGPGGGFQAGVILAAAVILYALIFGLDAAKMAIPPSWVRGGMTAGVSGRGGDDSNGVAWSGTPGSAAPARLVAAVVEASADKFARETDPGTVTVFCTMTNVTSRHATISNSAVAWIR